MRKCAVGGADLNNLDFDLNNNFHNDYHHRHDGHLDDEHYDDGDAKREYNGIDFHGARGHLVRQRRRCSFDVRAGQELQRERGVLDDGPARLQRALGLPLRLLLQQLYQHL